MANENPLNSLLEKISNDIDNKKKTPSERLILLSHERDFIVDRIKDTETELEMVEKTDADYVYITEQLRYMKSYKDTLGKRIKALVDKT